MFTAQLAMPKVYPVAREQPDKHGILPKLIATERAHS